MSKQGHLFLKKKKQKNFCYLARGMTRHRAQEQKFFAFPGGEPFFQKRSAFLL
jgi:hypothetical protein